MTPTNVLYLVAALVILALGAIVFLLGDSSRAAGFVAFATPVLVVLVAIIQSTQNAQNHAANQTRMAELEDKVKPSE